MSELPDDTGWGPWRERRIVNDAEASDDLSDGGRPEDAAEDGPFTTACRSIRYDTASGGPLGPLLEPTSRILLWIRRGHAAATPVLAPFVVRRHYAAAR